MGPVCKTLWQLLSLLIRSLDMLQRPPCRAAGEAEDAGRDAQSINPYSVITEGPPLGRLSKSLSMVLMSLDTRTFSHCFLDPWLNSHTKEEITKTLMVSAVALRAQARGLGHFTMVLRGW